MARYSECICVDNETRRVEVRELTEVMAENLSEVATVMSLNFLGGKATVWRDGVRECVPLDRGTLLELKRRAIWREEHAGMLS